MLLRSAVCWHATCAFVYTRSRPVLLPTSLPYFFAAAMLAAALTGDTKVNLPVWHGIAVQCMAVCPRGHDGELERCLAAMSLAWHTLLLLRCSSTRRSKKSPAWCRAAACWWQPACRLPQQLELPLWQLFSRGCWLHRGPTLTWSMMKRLVGGGCTPTAPCSDTYQGQGRPCWRALLQRQACASCPHFRTPTSMSIRPVPAGAGHGGASQPDASRRPGHAQRAASHGIRVLERASAGPAGRCRALGAAGGKAFRAGLAWPHLRTSFATLRASPWGCCFTCLCPANRPASTPCQ